MDSPMLEKLHQIDFEIMLEIKRICEKYNLTYYLCAGTLLGAVRHGGPIPWDDDSDISMPYNDYYTFINIAPKELQPEYFVQNVHTNEMYYFGYTKIMKRKTTMMRLDRKDPRFKQNIWVDIFPIIPVTKRNMKYKKLAYRVSKYLVMDNYIDYDRHRFFREEPIVFCLSNIFRIIPKKKRKEIYPLLLKKIYSWGDGNNVQYYTEVWCSMTIIFPADIYTGEPSKVSYMNEDFLAPNDYITYLKVHFGDYMRIPPESERNGHGFFIDTEHDYTYYLKAALMKKNKEA